MFSITSARAADLQIESIAVTQDDVIKLLGALSTALKPNDSTIPIVVMLKKIAEMPRYNPQWHYGGVGKGKDGSPNFFVWVNAALEGEAAENAIESGFLLAITDGGYAGPIFKKMYDTVAQEDALPASAPDPFLNRHRLAAELVNLVHLPKK